MSNRLRKLFIGLILSVLITISLLISQLSVEDEASPRKTIIDKFANSLNSIDGFLSDQIEFQRFKYLIKINGNLETKIDCIGHGNNQSCVVENLYFYQKTFWIFTTKSVRYPLFSVRIGAWISHQLIVNRRRFYSYVDLEEFVRIRINPIVIPNVTVYFDQPWLENIGHALFDGLYPAFVALIRFSPRHLHPFRILLSGSDDFARSDFTRDVYRRFSGLGIINATIFEILSNEEWFAFEELVVGSGDFCQRCLQSNLQIPAGITLNASKLFRDRIYRQYHFQNSHSNKQRHSDKILNAFIVDNKRFTSQDKQQINLAIEQINRDTRYSQRIIFINNQTKPKWPLIHVTYISYPSLAINNDASLQFNVTDIQSTLVNMTKKMFAHLLLLEQTDIYVTGPGTAQMYQTFLSDGSVNINLGGVAYLHRNDTSKNYTSFMEQYLTSGTPYIKGFYYPINERTKGIQKDILIQLLREAAQMILNGFSIPVNPHENLAPDGQLFVELCQLDEDFCKTLTDRWRDDHLECIDTWPEDIIHEKGPWSKRGIEINQGKFLSCKSNRTLINQLRIKYNIKSPSSSSSIR